jgi:hypothetical protein
MIEGVDLPGRQIVAIVPPGARFSIHICESDSQLRGYEETFPRLA